MNLHLPETAATFGSHLARHTALLGVAAAAIVGMVTGPAAAANSPASAPAHAATAHYTPVAHVSKSGKPAARPALKTLLPHGNPSHQASIKTSAGQNANAAAIVKAGIDMKLPARAMVLAVACSLQESKLHNYGNLGSRNDHDSQGLFQQRPSSGWGTPKQVTNPEHAAQSFYKRLVHVHNWRSMPATLAIQKVQVSAFPLAYAKWEHQAAMLVASTYAGSAAKAAAQAAHSVPGK